MSVIDKAIDTSKVGGGFSEKSWWAASIAAVTVISYLQ